MTKPLIASILLLFVIATLPPIDFGARDIRMLQTFSLDEAAFASQVREMIDSGSLAVDGFTYGSIYPYTGALLGWLYGLLFDLTDTAIIVLLRSISIGAAIVFAGATFLTARNLYDEQTGLIASAFVLSTPLVFRWSVEIHPDLLQLCFLTCGLYTVTSLARGFSLGKVLLSALFAGLAFGTKYAGAFLTPTIALALLLGIESDLSRTLRDRRFWTGAVCASVVFITTFALTNPYAILNLSVLRQDLEFTRRIVSDADGNALSWIKMLFSPAMGVVFGLGVLATIRLLVRKDWLANRGTACLLFWICSYVGFLLVDVHFIAGQYLLPVVPAFAILISFSIGSFANRFRLSWIKAGIAVPVIATQVAYAAPVFQDRTRDESSNPVIAAGLWLSEMYGPETTILYDTYAYIPSKFKLAETFFGLSVPVIQIFKPDLVVTRKSIRKRYRDPNHSTHFRLTDEEARQEAFLYLAPQRYRDIHYTYNYLEQDRTAYTLERDFNDVTVYRKKQQAEEDDSRESWERITAAQKGAGVEPVLAALAYSAFGDIHTQARNWAEAKVQYAKAIRLNSADIIPRYGYALALTHQDSFDTAEAQIERLGSLTSQPADVWVKLGWDYYEMGQYERSRKASRRAYDLAPDHPFTLYNIALTYLTEGRAREADSTYGIALARHPLPRETEDLLSRMIAEGSLKGESREAAERVLSSKHP